MISHHSAHQFHRDDVQIDLIVLIISNSLRLRSLRYVNTSLAPNRSNTLATPKCDTTFIRNTHNDVGFIF